MKLFCEDDSRKSFPAQSGHVIMREQLDEETNMSERIARLRARHDAMMARRRRGVDLCLAGEPDDIVFADCDEAEIEKIRNTVLLIRAFQEMSDAHDRDMALLDERDPIMAASVREFCGKRITRMCVVGGPHLLP